ncbi:MAG: nucleotide exchange factor GrpE [Methylococcaceae bacterium]|jgi:molecular chaperone GrpE
MSTDQEKPESLVETEAHEVNAAAEQEPNANAESADREVSLEELKLALEKAEQKAQENWEKVVRVQAEMENLKRRTQKDIESAHKYALEGFAKELLVVLDSLVLGLQAVSGDSPEVEKFRVGSELTIKQFESAFNKYNIEAIDPVGLTFNPEHHQAMTMQVIEGAEPNTVVAVFQKGYLLNGRLLRPAMVVVAKAPEPPQAETPSIDEQA